MADTSLTPQQLLDDAVSVVPQLEFPTDWLARYPDGLTISQVEVLACVFRAVRSIDSSVDLLLETGALIELLRDVVSPALRKIREDAAVRAMRRYTAEQVAEVTGMSLRIVRDLERAGKRREG